MKTCKGSANTAMAPRSTNFEVDSMPVMTMSHPGTRHFAASTVEAQLLLLGGVWILCPSQPSFRCCANTKVSGRKKKCCYSSSQLCEENK